MAILSWLGLNLATVLGVAQALLKLIKELLTGMLNIVFPLWVGHNEAFEASVMKVRDFCQTIDGWIESIKGFFLKGVS